MNPSQQTVTMKTKTSSIYNIGLSIFLLLVVFITSILVIYYKHLSRQLFADLQALHKTRDALHVEWTQLLLEQGAWGSDARLEKIAREKLNMKLPASDAIVVIKE